jgi:hypothetical protein
VKEVYTVRSHFMRGIRPQRPRIIQDKFCHRNECKAKGMPNFLGICIVSNVAQKVRLCYYFLYCTVSNSELGLHSRYSSWLWVGGQRGWSLSPGEVKNFCIFDVQTGFGAHPASYPMGTRGSFPGGKAASA